MEKRRIIVDNQGRLHELVIVITKLKEKVNGRTLESVEVKLHVDHPSTYCISISVYNIWNPWNYIWLQKCETRCNVSIELGSFENSYIPENSRTPKPLTFSKNRFWEAKNRSNTSPESRPGTRSGNTITHTQTHENKAITNTRILRGSDSVQILHPRATTREFITQQDYNEFSLNSLLYKFCTSKLHTQYISQEQAKLSPISLIAAAPHHHLERPVEAPTSSNSAVANPATDSAVINTATDSSSVSTGLDTPPDPEIHRGPLTLSQLCKHSTGETFSVLVFKTQRLFVTVPGTPPVLPLSQNLLTGLDFLTRSANIPLAPEFMFAK
ncbi:hypothetical protein LXL04_023561 [Taraxacum kok-saghyz]